MKTEFKYNDCASIKAEYEKMAQEIRSRAELVFKHAQFRGCSGGYVCDGFSFKTADWGEVLIVHNMWDGYDGESPPNASFSFPFRYLNMNEKDIEREFASCPAETRPQGVEFMP